MFYYDCNLYVFLTNKTAMIQAINSTNKSWPEELCNYAQLPHPSMSCLGIPAIQSCRFDRCKIAVLQ